MHLLDGIMEDLAGAMHTNMYACWHTNMHVCWQINMHVSLNTSVQICMYAGGKNFYASLCASIQIYACVPAYKYARMLAY